jgi:TPR repeat protein
MRIAAGLLVVAVLVAPLAAQREPPDVAQLRMRAEQGEPIEQFLLGAVYAQGSGVSRDYVEALRWFRLAAAQGVPEASHNIGVMYANGQGVPQNDAQAYFWFNLATAGDLDAAQRERTMAAMERAATGLALERQAAIQQLATRCVDAGFTACQEPE